MKTIVLSVSIFLFSSVFTSCQSSFEKAYESESLYRMSKDGHIEMSDSAKYKAEFIRTYQTMSPTEQQRYKLFRKNKKTEEKRAYQEYLQQQKDMAAMLND